MSRWAEGNFDVNFASDLLILLVRQIAEQILDCLNDEDRAQFFCGETEIMPGVDVLLTLSKAYPDIVLLVLKDEFSISDWKKHYMSIYDDNVDEDDSFKVDRRMVIEDTFSQLEALIEQFE